jgi:hypothetical protein
MRAVWVVGNFEGRQARSVMDQAGSGICYFILESSEGRNPTCIAAFRRPCDSPIPEYLEEVRDRFKIEKYEKMRKERQGLTA